ncbi:hypothetical protein Rhe02_05970 [Rhizocola hellebori]|uniref:Type IV methyl-directed restriction enzyme EcoKMcrB subunit DNA-binding domain-containing protein n=1 Tax=Rhizocola hellebori TaxID=1392758 RepID=A0A8J3VD99_9ACTN|nr:DUF3578 domain-containing protein [Rhizocola hellebori]GIH02530.1 hypothetical protein Rhe02_05970 [Rhizocola hellebori]
MRLRKLIGEIGAQYDRQLPMSSQAHRLLGQAQDQFRQWIPAGHLVECFGGSGEPAVTPMIAIFHPEETTTIRHGIFVAYLFAEDMSTVTLTLNQGVGEMADHLGRAQARTVVAMQAAAIRAVMRPADIGDLSVAFDLQSTAALSVDFEHANIVSLTYRLDSLSSESAMVADLQQFVRLYTLALEAREVARRNGRHELITSTRRPTPDRPTAPDVKPVTKQPATSEVKPLAEPAANRPAAAEAKQPAAAEAKQPGGSEAKRPAAAEAKQPGGSEAKRPGGSEAKRPGGSGANRPAASDVKAAELAAQAIAAAEVKALAEAAAGQLAAPEVKPRAKRRAAAKAKPLAETAASQPAPPEVKPAGKQPVAAEAEPVVKQAAVKATVEGAAESAAASPDEKALPASDTSLQVLVTDTKAGRKPRALAGTVTRRGILAALVAAPIAYAAPTTAASKIEGLVTRTPLRPKTAPVFTIDVSQHDWNRRGGNLDWARIRGAGIAGMCARASYGDPEGYQWPTYHFASFSRAAREAGMGLRGGYHNLVRGDQASINRQVDWLRRELDRNRANWAMLDIERYSELIKAEMWPRWEDVRRFDDRWAEVDNRILVAYLPPWNWSKHLGQPDLREFRGPLIASNYPREANEDFKELYEQIGGNDGRGWAEYGNRVPEGWQYSSRAKVPGAPNICDVNAWRISYEELKAMLTGTGQRAEG